MAVKEKTWIIARNVNPHEKGQYPALLKSDDDHAARDVVALWDGKRWITAPGRVVEYWSYPTLKARPTSYVYDEDFLLFSQAGILTAEAIATMLKRTESSVKVRAHLLGISLAVVNTYNEWSARDENFLIELVKDGFTSNEIASKLERSRNSVYSKIEAFRQKGILPRRGKAA